MIYSVESWNLILTVTLLVGQGALDAAAIMLLVRLHKSDRLKGTMLERLTEMVGMSHTTLEKLTELGEGAALNDALMEQLLIDTETYARQNRHGINNLIDALQLRATAFTPGVHLADADGDSEAARDFERTG